MPDAPLEDRIGNRVEDYGDVVFRLGPSPHKFFARRLFSSQLVIIASSEYPRAKGGPRTLAELPLHGCSVFRHPIIGAVVSARVKVGKDPLHQPVIPALVVDDELLEVEPSSAGGVAQVNKELGIGGSKARKMAR